MARRLDKPWIELSAVAAHGLPAQLGVFELADPDGAVVRIGFGGGREPFGLRSAIQAAVSELGSERAQRVRYEVTHAYLTRWEELLMLYRHDHGELPAGNPVPNGRLGRLRPDGGHARSAAVDPPSRGW